MWTVAIVLVVLWALGLITSYTMGGLIHLFLIVALIVIAVNLVQGRDLLK